ncbi:hypothetical protein ACVIWU_002618 [Bradyrhizobium sp. USDA 4509]
MVHIEWRALADLFDLIETKSRKHNSNEPQRINLDCNNAVAALSLPDRAEEQGPATRSSTDRGDFLRILGIKANDNQLLLRR